MASVGVLFEDMFVGHRSYSATATSNAGHGWDVAATGSGTVAGVDGGRGVSIDNESTGEVQNTCLYWGDILGIDIDDIIEASFWVKMNQATLDATSMFAIGLTGDRNDAIDSIAQAAIFRLIGASAAVLVETDDGTNNNDDVATGATLGTTTKRLTISFATGKSDVRFFIDGQPVATGTTFDMSAYSGALQPLAQLQKTSDTNTDGVTIERVRITARS